MLNNMMNNMMNTVLEPTPIVTICESCGGDGEIYSRVHFRHGHPTGMVKCGTCKGEGHVTAKCEMMGCSKPATYKDEDGNLLCDEHAPHAVCDCCGGLTDNGTFMAAGTETTACNACLDKAAREYLGVRS